MRGMHQMHLEQCTMTDLSEKQMIMYLNMHINN